jgi:hypothetical protein
MRGQQYPTSEQLLKCFILCQNLTATYLLIALVRAGERTGKIFILAGEETEIVIDRDGTWGYES